MADRAGIEGDSLRHLGKLKRPNFWWGVQHVGVLEQILQLFQPISQPLARHHGTEPAQA